jgi:transposase
MSKQAQKPPVIERVAAMAMQLGARHLADYGAVTSRHDFTQRQLMSCLILRAYLKTTYRGVLELLAASPGVRRELGLADKLPHYSTLAKFSARSQVVEIAQKLVGDIGRAAAAQAPQAPAAAMDSTGLALNNASDYFCLRKGKRPVRQWVKVSVVVLCGSLLPLGMVMDLGASPDCKQAPALLAQAQAAARPSRLYADAGYDAEWIHTQCRQEWNVETVIKPNRRHGMREGTWRSGMTEDHLKARQYGRRWAVESFFSGLKRTMGSALSARRPKQMLAEAALKVLAYALRR